MLSKDDILKINEFWDVEVNDMFRYGVYDTSDIEDARMNLHKLCQHFYSAGYIVGVDAMRIQAMKAIKEVLPLQAGAKNAN